MTSQLTEDGAALFRAEAYLSEPGEPLPLPWEVTDRGLSGLQAAWPLEHPHSEPLGRSTPPDGLTSSAQLQNRASETTMGLGKFSALVGNWEIESGFPRKRKS